MEVEGSRGVGSGMLGRAEKVTTGAVVAEGLVAAGTVVPRGCVAAGTTKVERLAVARVCWAAGATEVARLAPAGGCWAAGETRVAGLAEARVCCAAGATKVAGLGEAGGCWAAGATNVAGLAEAEGCWAAGAKNVAGLAEAGGCWVAGTGGGCRESAHIWEMYVLWLRSATTMAAAVERFCASRELRRPSYSFRVRAVSRIPARVASEEESGVAVFAGSGRISRSCSVFAKSSACWSAVVRACSIPSSTSRRETNIILTCMPGSGLSQTGARY